jgi:Domain of unknown function (DUF4112)
LSTNKRPAAIREPLPPDIALAVRIADWLDDRFIDPILGLVLPGAGDVLTTLVGLYAVVVAIRRRMPAVVVVRMLRNLGVDLLVGAVPIAGDAFDFFYKAHRRNADLLLERHVLGPSPVSDWLAVGVSFLVLLLLLAVPFVVLGFLFAHISR